MKTFVIPSIKKSVAPTANENLSSGYPIGQHWFDTATGKEYYHSSDGVWEPFATTHKALPDKNEEADFQHIDTTVTKPTLDEADKVAIKDSVTGKMVLTPKSNLEGDNLVFEYIHSGNKENNVLSYNSSNGTFTTEGACVFENNEYVYTALREFDGLPKISIYTPLGLYNSPFFVVNKTANTFQLSSTANGSPIVFANNPTQDVSKFKFEKLSVFSLDVDGLPDLKNMKIVIQLMRLSDQNIIQIFPNKQQQLFLNITESTGHYFASIVVNSDLSSWGMVECNIYNDSNYVMANVEQNLVTNNGDAVVNSRRAYLSKSSNYETINSLQFHYLFPANGCKIRIYKL